MSFKIKTNRLLLLFFLFKSYFLLGQNPVSELNGLVSPIKNVVFYEDESGKYGIQDIVALENQVNFKRFKSDKINLGFTQSTIWLKISSWNQSNKEIEKILELNNKDLDQVDLLYYGDSGKIIHQKSGDLRTINEISEKGFFPIFRVKIAPNTTKVHYLRIKSTSPIQFEMRFWNEISYLNYLHFNIRFLWFFIGILILRIFFSISIHRFVEASAFKFYTLSIVAFLLGAILNSIQLKSYLPFPSVLHFIVNVFYFLIPLALSLWIYHFLNLSKQKIVFYLIYGIGFIGILSLLIFKNHHFPILFSNIYIIAVQLFLLFFCIKSYSEIAKNNRIFLIASIFPIVICTIYPAINLSILTFQPILIILITFFTFVEAIFIPIYLGRFIFKNYIQNQSKIVIAETKNVMYELKPNAIEMMSSDETLLLQIKEIIEKNLQNSQFGIEELCSELNLSPTQIRRKLKSLTGLTIVEFIRKIRLNRAAELLKNKAGTISEIGYKVGFENMSYFSKVFKEEFGVLPSEFQ